LAAKYFEQQLVEDRIEVWNDNIAIDSLYTRTVFPSNKQKLSETETFMMYLVFAVFVLLFGVRAI
jgi:hypothetical protein